MTKSYCQKLQEAHDRLNLNLKLSQSQSLCIELGIKLRSERFLREFAMVAPAAYLEIMRINNGVDGGGIKLWGLTKSADSKESCIFEENEAFGYLPSRELVYFGTTKDGHYYLFDKVRERYLLKISGFRTDQDLEIFVTCDAMLDHLLNAQLRSYGPIYMSDNPTTPI